MLPDPKSDHVGSVVDKVPLGIRVAMSILITSAAPH
jgi:hypothetical protein